MKIVTICGSLKFKEEMIKTANELQLYNNFIVFTPVLFDKAYVLSNKQLLHLKEIHFNKIDKSDIIFILNKNNYIGESTKLEIEYAKKLNKKIVYYTDYIERSTPYE